MRRILRGAVAGLIGTAVMTTSQYIELSLTKRPLSTVPGQVGARLLSRPDDEVESLSTPMHWAHGVALGALRGALSGMGLRGLKGALTFFAIMWAGDAVLYRVLKITDWPWRWTRAELATDVGHKALYALVTSGSYNSLTRSATPRALRR